MSNCKNCGKKLKLIPGRRQKEFCNSTCRSSYWKKNNKPAPVKKTEKKQLVVEVKKASPVKVKKEAIPSGLSKSDTIKWHREHK